MLLYWGDKIIVYNIYHSLAINMLQKILPTFHAPPSLVPSGEPLTSHPTQGPAQSTTLDPLLSFYTNSSNLASAPSALPTP